MRPSALTHLSHGHGPMGGSNGNCPARVVIPKDHPKEKAEKSSPWINGRKSMVTAPLKWSSQRVIRQKKKALKSSRSLSLVHFFNFCQPSSFQPFVDLLSFQP